MWGARCSCAKGRNLRPKPAGEKLLLDARRLQRLSDEAMASQRRPEASGVVRLGLPEDYRDRPVWAEADGRDKAMATVDCIASGRP
jgi:hypothetical protein